MRVTLIVGGLLAGLIPALLTRDAHAATASTINFQARLMASVGNIVPDGDYNIEFKLYDASSSSGSSQGSCSGDAHCLWVETRTSGNKVRVANGYLSVDLGSVTAFSNSIDWSQNMYLTMNIGGTGSASWDGEMNPRLHMTGVPYAFAAGTVGGLSAGQLVQLAPNTIQGDASTNSSININKTGASGNLLTLQQNGATAFSIGYSGITTIKTIGSDSTAAFQIQNHSGDAAFTVDSSNMRIGVGNTAPAVDLDVGPSSLASSQIVQANIGDIVLKSQQGAANTLTVTTSRGSNGNLNIDAASTKGVYLSPTTTNNNYLAAGGGNVRIGDTNNPSYKLDVVGDINSSTGLRVGGTVVCDTTGATGCVAKSGSGYYIHNDAALQQTANINIVSGAVGNSAALFQAAASATSPVVVIKGGATPGSNGDLLQLQNAAGTPLITVDKVGKLSTTNSIAVSVTDANAFKVTDGTNTLFNVDTSNTQVVVGTTALTGSRFSVYSNTNTAGNAAVAIAQIGTADILQLYGGGTSSTNQVLTVSGSGTIAQHLMSDSTMAFSIQQASSGAYANRYLFNVNTSNGYVINNGTSAPGNILQNPGFEAGAFTATTGNTASGWDLTASRSLIITDATNTNTRTGYNGLQVNPNSTTIDVPTATYYAVLPGQQYYLDGYYRSATGTTGTAGLSLVFYDRDYTNATAVTQTLNPATSFNHPTNAATVPSGKYYMRVVVTVNSNSTTGTWYFDDLYAAKTSYPNTQIQADSSGAFRVQSADGTSTALGVDTINNYVGIGTGTPGRTFDVAISNSTTTAPAIRLTQYGTGDATMEFANSSKSFNVGIDTSDGSKFKISSSTAANSSNTVGVTSSAGGTADSGNNNYVTSTQAGVASANGTLSSIQVYINAVDPTNQLMQVALYQDAGNTGGTANKIGQLVSSSASKTVATTGWQTFSLSGGTITSGKTYWVAFNHNGAGTGYKYGAGGKAAFFQDTNIAGACTTVFGNWPADLSANSCVNGPYANTNNSTYYVNYTYTISAGAYDSFNRSLFSLTDTGQALFQNSSDSSSAFQIQNSAGTNTVFNADTTNTRVGINTSAPAYTLDVNGDINVSSGSAIRINGASINTNGTLSNVAYLGQANTFTAANTIKTATNTAGAFQVQNSLGSSAFVVNTTSSNLISNYDFENVTTGWTATGTGASVAADTTYSYTGAYSLKLITGTTANAGAKFTLNPVVTSASTTYTVSFYARRAVGDGTGFTDLIVRYSPNNSATADCNTTAMNSQTVLNTGWSRFYCSFSSATTPTTTGYILIKDTNSGTNHTVYIDGVQLEQTTAPTSYGVGTIAINGTVNSPITIKNISNSTSALSVVNAASNTLLNVDSINNSVTLNQPIFTVGTNGIQKASVDSSGAFNISDNLQSPTKSWRFRTDGASLDLESAGVGSNGYLYWSGWTGANYTGTQVTFLIGQQSQNRLVIGSGSASTTPTTLLLDNKSDAGDPSTGIANGSMYYNANSGLFRCYQNSEWRNCVSSVKTTVTSGQPASPNATNTTSSTYVDLGLSPSSASFTKAANGTKIVIRGSIGAYSTATLTGIKVGVKVNGTDYDCGYYFFNVASQHMPVSCMVAVTGLNAGAYTAQLRWKVTTGSGTATSDYNDWYSITVEETD